MNMPHWMSCVGCIPEKAERSRSAARWRRTVETTKRELIMSDTKKQNAGDGSDSTALLCDLPQPMQPLGKDPHGTVRSGHAEISGAQQ